MNQEPILQKALIVDDEMTNRLILRSLLKKLDYQTIEAENGLQAIELFGEEQPSIVFMDVMMPEKDGYEMCKELKADSQLCEIPVLLLTAVASHVTSTRYSHADGMSTKADDYIAKPASAESISQSIR